MRERILVVDDSPYMRAVLRGMLTTDGFEVAEASEARSGIDLYKSERPDVVLMNLTMPGIDGISAMRELLECDCSARVIICSSRPSGQVAPGAFEAGARGYLEMPCEPDRLVVAIRDALRPRGEHDTMVDGRDNTRSDGEGGDDIVDEFVVTEVPAGSPSAGIGEAGDHATHGPEMHRMLRTLGPEAMAAFSDILLGLNTLPPADQVRIIRGLVKLWHLSIDLPSASSSGDRPE